MESMDTPLQLDRDVSSYKGVSMYVHERKRGYL